MNARGLISLCCILWTSLLAAQQPADSLRERLDSTVFSAERNTSVLELGGGLDPTTVKLDQLRKLPSITGSPDPIRMLRLLPGVQTGMELDAGLHVQGTESSHCLLSVEGVPFYGANHVLGLFSTFIPTHYREMQFTPYAAKANRLGGTVDMQLPDRVPQRFRAQLSAGLFEAEGTVDIPLGSRSGLFVSGRKSYLNLLYGRFLRLDVYSFAYGMGDGNITWYWEPNDRDRVWVDAFAGGDVVDFDSARSSLSFKLNWWNWMGALHHRHRWDLGEMKQSVYYTALDMAIDFKHVFYNFYIPSRMETAGYNNMLQMGRWRFGAQLAWHHALPQQVNVVNADLSHTNLDESQSALEATVEAHYTWPITASLTLESSLKGVFLATADGARYPALLPELRLDWDLHHAGKVEVLAGLARQNLFQTGSSALGLPPEFWYIAGKNIRPQGSHYASVSWSRNFLNDRYAVSLSGYYRYLTHQLEYNGSIVDYLDPDYNTPAYLTEGDGRNFGLCVTLHKQAGDFTGWIAYTLSRSLRSFRDEVYPSNHERIHELNAVGSYTRGKWDFSGVLVAASGLPYTRAESFYMNGGTLIMEYSPRNAYRMNPYFRLDLSTTYYFHRGGRVENGLTFALYNALGFKNDISLQLKVSEDKTSFSYIPLNLHIRFLPSLSYFHKF